MKVQQEAVKEEIRPPTDTYERMCSALYAYRFGTIGFIDLLRRFEEILGIKSPRIDNQLNANGKE